MANRIVHFEIEAKDTKRASKFYHSAFGWKMDQQIPNERLPEALRRIQPQAETAQG